MRVMKTNFVLFLAALCAALLCGAPTSAQPAKKPPVKVKSKAAPPKPNPNPNTNLLYGIGAALFVIGGAALALRRKKSKAPIAAPSAFSAWRTLTDSAGLGSAETDAQGQIVRHNTAFAKMLGQNELRGVLLERFAVPADALQLKEHFEHLRDGKNTQFQVEQAFYRADGHPFRGRLTVVKTTGNGASAGALLEDISALHQAQSGWNEARSAIHDLSAVLAGESGDLSEKLRALLAMGCNRFGLETGILAELIVTSEPVEGSLPRSVRAELVQAVSPDERIRRGKAYEVDVASGTAAGAPPGLASLTRVALAGDHRAQQATSERGGTVFGALVSIGGQIYGALNFSSITPRPTPFGESDLELLQLMAQWVGSEIERVETRADLDARQQELETKQMELLAANAQLEALATTDGLTGVKNRRAFDQRLEEEFQRARRYSTPLSLLLLDVDKFKQYNDSFGHPAGDEVLKQVATVLQAGIRATDSVARYGGEEFALVLPNTDAPGAIILAERVRVAIATVPWAHRVVTASLGACSFRGDMKTRAELTAGADAALYASKEAGRNRVTHVNDLTSRASETQA